MQYRFRTFQPFLDKKSGLELGCGDGSMTKYLRRHFEKLTVVDGAKELVDKIPSGESVNKVVSLFEDYAPTEKFKSIVMEHILEHIEDPVALLKRSRSWLDHGGKIFIGVPNALSIHRQVAVKMGLLKTPNELNDRDKLVGHRRVYDWNLLKQHIESAGLKVEHRFGVFFKPLSNEQIDRNWTPEMKEGFFLLGQDFPDFAAEISVICS
jgi:SAM-dependent methyltransferase